MISIVIPAYEMKGLGTAFLRRGLDSINKQVIDNHHPIEVIVSDHSKNQEISRFIEQYTSRFPIRHCINPSGHGNISQNVNFGIDRAQYTYIKVLFQDSLLVETNYLETISNIIRDTSPPYILSNVLHTTDTIQFIEEMEPKSNEFLIFGQNTVSEPSVLTIRKSIAQEILFDERVTLLMDCDFYYQLFNRYPSLQMATGIHVAIGVWSGQTQRDLTTQNTIKEILYLISKYPERNLKHDALRYCEFLADKDTALAKGLLQLLKK